jgi:AcrR family transcriptional regulator
MLAAGCDASTDAGGAADAALAPPGSVTYWFGNRDGLISALVEWICDQSERQAGAIDGLLLDRLTHPPQGQEVVVAALRWLLSGAPPDGSAGDQPGPRST